MKNYITNEMFNEELLISTVVNMPWFFCFYNNARTLINFLSIFLFKILFADQEKSNMFQSTV